MRYGPIAELERDACLLEDVVSDALDAWAHVRDVTPGDVDRLTRVQDRLSEVRKQMIHLRLELWEFLRRVEQERKKA